MDQENTDPLTLEELFDRIAACDVRCASYLKRMGKLYWFCIQKIGRRNSMSKGPSIKGELLKRGVRLSSIGVACTLAQYYAKVAAGEITEDQYVQTPQQKIIDALRLEKGKSLSAKTLTRNAKIEGASPKRMAVLSESLEDDTPKNASTVSEALAHAQEWLIEARARLPERTEQWAEAIQKALTGISAVRFEAQELVRAEATKAKQGKVAAGCVRGLCQDDGMKS